MVYTSQQNDPEMFCPAATCTILQSRENKASSAIARVNWGLVFCPLLFLIVLEALSRL